jgi:hypothetical protein
MSKLEPKLLAEFIGTFAFVFIGAGAAAVVGDGVGLPGIAAIAFAHGLTIMVFAFAYGSVSGGHMNPAVTVGVLAAGAMCVRDAIRPVFCTPPQSPNATEGTGVRRALRSVHWSKEAPSFGLAFPWPKVGINGIYPWRIGTMMEAIIR